VIKKGFFFKGGVGEKCIKNFENTGNIKKVPHPLPLKKNPLFVMVYHTMEFIVFIIGFHRAGMTNRDKKGGFSLGDWHS